MIKNNNILIRFNLLLFYIMIVIILSCVFNTCYAEEINNINEIQLNQNNEEEIQNNIKDYAVNDFSRFDNIILPDVNTIDYTNIDKYIPVELFNKTGTTVYCGLYYGFVLNVNTNINRVLLFTIDYFRHPDGDGYGVRIEVVYEKAFSKTLIGIREIASPVKLAIGNFRLKNMIIDSQFENQSKNISGAFITQYTYGGKFSNINLDIVDDVTEFAACELSINMLDNYFESVSQIGSKIPVASTIINVAEIVEKCVPNVDSIPNDNNNINFPLTKEGQLSSKECNYELIKSCTVEMKKENKNWVLAYDKEINNNICFEFRINNPDKIRYYIMNSLMFSAYEYGFGQELTEIAGSETKYETLFNTTTDIVNCERLLYKEGKFIFNSGVNFMPILDGNYFKVVPQETGWYDLSAPSNINIVIKDNQSVIQKNANNGLYYLDKNVEYEVIIQTSQDNITLKKDIFLQNDFDGKGISFACVGLIYQQECNLNERFDCQDLAYYMIDNYNSNQLFEVVIENGVTENLDIKILDYDLNVVADGIANNGKLLCNYIYNPNEIYYVTVINNNMENVNICIKEKGEIFVDNNTDDYLANIYYKIEELYTQYYYVLGNVKAVYDSDFIEIYRTETNDYLLNENKSYYVLPSENSKIDIFISRKLCKNISVDETYNDDDEYLNSLYLFLPKISSRYSIIGGQYDIYCNESILASNTNSCYLETGKEYIIVKKQKEGQTRIEIDAISAEINNKYNVKNTKEELVYKIVVKSEVRLDVKSEPNIEYEVYDSSFVKIIKDHGYALVSGEYYFVMNQFGDYTFTIVEYIQEVKIKFLLDNQEYIPEIQDKYYYGKNAKLPIPVKDNYDFDGWMYKNERLTASNGVTFAPLLEDEYVVEASMIARKLVMQINSTTGEAKWWSGDRIVDDIVEVNGKEGFALSLLIDLKEDYYACSDGYKEGHYIDTFTYQCVNTENHTDHYVLEPVWKKENYFIIFHFPSGEQIGVELTYAQEINDTFFDKKVYNYNDGYQYSNTWIYGVDKIINFGSTTILPDMTPNKCTEKINGEVNEVFLTMDISYVTYNIRINNIVETIKGTEICKIRKLSEYVDNLDNYIGYNVTYQYLDNNSKSIQYVEGSDIKVNDIIINDGKTSHDINIEIARTPINVIINYKNQGKETVKSNIKESEILSEQGKVDCWHFDGWKYDDKKVIRNKYEEIGIYYTSRIGSEISETRVLEAIQIRDNYYAANNNGIITLNASSDVVCVDYTGSITYGNDEWVIPSHVNEVIFKGDLYINYGIEINVEKRSNAQTLFLYFQGIHFKACENKALIKAKESNLVIKSFDTTYFAGDKINSGPNRDTGVIICNDLKLTGQSFKIDGAHANGLDEQKNGNSGGNVIECTGDIIIDCFSLVSTAGAGTHGGDGENASGQNGRDGKVGEAGHKGGNGGIALLTNKNIIVTSSVKLMYISGGKGGTGGQGGSGSNGLDGVNGEFAKPTINPGNGGDGGPGGSGGNGGNAVRCQSFKILGNEINDNIKILGGSCGYGGSGGTGGQPGKPCETIWGNPREGVAGKQGQNGSDGTSGIPGI